MQKCSPRMGQRLTGCLCTFIFLGLQQAGIAQTLEAFEKAGSTSFRGPIILHSADVGGLDVLHYDLSVRLAMTDESFGGNMRITLLVNGGPGTDRLVLNAALLTIDSASVNGQRGTVLMDSLNETMTIQMGTPHYGGETLDVSIDYRREPGVNRPGGRWGYWYFRDTLGIPANLGYTMSEPSDARFWMPCQDDPRDKATADISITVPAEYVVASNGKLTGTLTNPDTTVTWKWQERHPITTYLMSITASRFTVSTLPFVRAPGDTIPIQYYVWQPDSLETAVYLPTVRDMMVALSYVFGPYPFDKYGMTAVKPFNFGGMEHQSITTLNWYRKTDEKVVVHELAHQWWGDLVTCATWPDIWLNESFATYSEAIWAEFKGGKDSLRAYMKTELEHFYYGSWQGAVYDPEGQGFNLFDDVVYSKGAWVLHTLRGVIGDSAFFRTLTAYRAKYAGRSVATDEFRAVADSVTGLDLSWFFHEWIYGPGWPVYSMNSGWTGDSLTVTINQLQTAGWPTYRMPIRIRAYGTGRETTLTVLNDRRTQTFRVPLSFAPDSVVLDPDSWILKQVSKPTTSVTDKPLPAVLALEQNYPNPFNPVTNIRYHLPAQGFARLEVFDLLGAQVSVLEEGDRDAGDHVVALDGTHLASGVYVCRLSAGGLVRTIRMLLLR
jgi:aminopeptidase N